MGIEVFEELKRLIVQSGLSPTRLAHDSNVHPATIDKWLDGSVQLPRIDTMLKVARIVGKEVQLTAPLRKMVSYYGPSFPPGPPPPPIPIKPRYALWRLQ